MSLAKTQLIECEVAVSVHRHRVSEREREMNKDLAELQTPKIIT